MKLWSRILMGGLVATLALSLMATNADAASKKKKKKEEKKKTESYSAPMSHHKMIIEGTNVAGRPGFLFSDSAATASKGQIMGAVSPAFYSLGSLFSMPFGGAYGITNDIQVHANTSFLAGGGASQLGYLVFGGKYGFHHISTPGLDIAAGLDFAIGPLTNSVYSQFCFDPYGVVTYAFKDGFTLNGQIGVFIPSGQTVTINPGFGLPSYTFTYTPPAAFQFNADAAYPFDSELTGIAELAANPGTSGSGNTLLLAGLRTGKTDVKLQGYGGFQFAGTTGVVIGGTLSLFSK